jgi:hypothetical protein
MGNEPPFDPNSGFIRFFRDNQDEMSFSPFGRT